MQPISLRQLAVSEALRAAFVVLPALVFAKWLPGAAVTIGALLLFISWHALEFISMLRWSRSEPSVPPNHLLGVWYWLAHLQYLLHEGYRRRKARIARLLARFQESTAAMPDPMVVLGARYEVEWFNEAASRLLDLQSPLDLRRPVVQLIRDPAFVNYLTRGDFDSPIEFALRGELQMSARIVPYGSGRYLLALRDVSSLHRLDRMRRDFVANVSHELRTPLTVVAGYLETLLDDEALPDDYRPSLASMQAQAQRMQRIVEDLLTLARLEGQEHPQASLEPVDVVAMVAELQRDAEIMAAAKSQTVRLVIESDCGLRGSSAELHSAFANLLSNAVRYTPAERDIEMRWTRRADGRLVFAVHDEGIGVAPEHIPRLTERFYRAERDRSRHSGGTGLGLAIVKHVLQRHSAQLEIESELGVGSVFRCVFPPHRAACERFQRRQPN